MVRTNDGIVGTIFGLTEIDPEKDRSKVLTPEIYREIDQGNFLTPRKYCKIDRDKVLGTDLRFLEKSRKTGQKDEKKQEKIKKNTLKMEPFGNYLTFGNRL